MFSPQHCLTIIVHISQNWMRGIKLMTKKYLSSSDVKILRKWISELFPTILTDIALYKQLPSAKNLS